MAIIQVEKLQKHFHVNRHHTGRFATLRNLVTRQYDVVKAVDNISFSVAKGELVGYLGPNGAGKSTTLKMLTGLLVPTGGHVSVNGYTPWQERKQYVRRIGAVFGQRTTLWWDLPVIESLTLLQHVYRVPAGRFKENMAHFETLLELTPFLNTPVRSLSLGQRMRADLAAALLHDPDILFLDEPTIGLDVVAKERIRRFIRHINQENGTTVILTTHDLADVAQLCQRIMIIDNGGLLFDGQLDTLQTRFGGSRQLVVDFAEEYEDVGVAGATVAQREGARTTYHFKREEMSASRLIGQLSQQFRIRDLSVREPEVEETIRRIYEERLLVE